MYWNMEINSNNPVINRAISLIKLIKLITFSLAGEGYLNFMEMNLDILSGLIFHEKATIGAISMLEDNGAFQKITT